MNFEWKGGEILLPDDTEPIRAFRRWNIESGGPFNSYHLASTGMGSYWRPGVNEAACFAQAGHRQGQVPHKKCSCGFWGIADPRDIPFTRNSDNHAWGLIEMWGRIVIGNLGFRSQYAKIIQLISMEPFSELQQAATYMEVPITTLHGWSELPKVTDPAQFASEPELELEQEAERKFRRFRALVSEPAKGTGIK